MATREIVKWWRAFAAIPFGACALKDWLDAAPPGAEVESAARIGLVSRGLETASQGADGPGRWRVWPGGETTDAAGLMDRWPGGPRPRLGHDDLLRLFAAHGALGDIFTHVGCEAQAGGVELGEPGFNLGHASLKVTEWLDRRQDQELVDELEAVRDALQPKEGEGTITAATRMATDLAAAEKTAAGRLEDLLYVRRELGARDNETLRDFCVRLNRERFGGRTETPTPPLLGDFERVIREAVSLPLPPGVDSSAPLLRAVAGRQELRLHHLQSFVAFMDTRLAASHEREKKFQADAIRAQRDAQDMMGRSEMAERSDALVEIAKLMIPEGLSFTPADVIAIVKKLQAATTQARREASSSDGLREAAELDAKAWRERADIAEAAERELVPLKSLLLAAQNALGVICAPLGVMPHKLIRDFTPDDYQRLGELAVMQAMERRSPPDSWRDALVRYGLAECFNMPGDPLIRAFHRLGAKSQAFDRVAARFGVAEFSLPENTEAALAKIRDEWAAPNKNGDLHTAARDALLAVCKSLGVCERAASADASTRRLEIALENAEHARRDSEEWEEGALKALKKAKRKIRKLKAKLKKAQG